MLRLSILASLLLAAMTACSRSNPQVSPSRLGTQLYKALDDEAREAVDARAVALSERLGVKVEPSEVLQVHGLGPGLRVSGLEAKVEDDTQATLAEGGLMWLVSGWSSDSASSRAARITASRR